MKKTLLSAVCALLLFIPCAYAAKSSGIKPVSEASSEPSASTIQETMKEFKNLSKQERKEKLKEVKKAVKQFKADKKGGAAASTDTLLLVILAILLPPLAVYLHQGEINNKFWIDLILTLLFFIPGIIYALIVILGNG